MVAILVAQVRAAATRLLERRLPAVLQQTRKAILPARPEPRAVERRTSPAAAARPPWVPRQRMVLAVKVVALSLAAKVALFLVRREASVRLIQELAAAAVPAVLVPLAAAVGLQERPSFGLSIHLLRHIPMRSAGAELAEQQVRVPLLAATAQQVSSS